MCGRFFVEPDDTAEELTRMLSQLQAREQRRNPDFHLKRGEICPGDTAAVIALNRQLTPTLFAMKWGFSLDKKLVFNARSETAAQRPLFSDSMKQRRCLIPASAYFEWDHREAKPSKYRFRPEGTQLLYLAGLYRLDESGPVFTILTRDAAPDIACFHDRMPVIAARSQARAWLDQRQSPDLLLAQPVTRLEWQRV